MELLKKMLEKEPSNRISAQECLNHPWIQSLAKETSGTEPQKPEGSMIEGAKKNLEKLQME